MFKKFIEVRELFLNFFKSKNHNVVKGSSLIPFNDNSLLFTNAGMNQFKDIFLGIKDIKYNNIVTIQSCLRVGGKHNDLKNIGYTSRHNTFFEMMGNFSFNCYFKELAIIYAWELLTSKNWYSISKDRLIVTVHKNDKETYYIWSKIIGLSKDNIFLLGNDKIVIDLNSDNFWRMSKLGPCGYSTEIFFIKDISLENNIDNFKKNISNYLEIWNLVFIEFNIGLDNKITNLYYKSVDTGMGLERICSVLQNNYSNFNIDLFINMKNIISKFFNIKITKLNLYIFNIISDHIRTIVFLMLEGLLPSNEYRGYVLRKIIRRTIYHIKLLKVNKIFLYKLLDVLYIFFEKNYSIDKDKFFSIKDILYNEEKNFLKSINLGLNILNSFIFKKNNYKKKIESKVIFLLYDTYGLPIDLIVDVCKYNNVSINLSKFNNLLDNQKKKSKKNNIFNNIFLNIGGKNKTIFLGYKYTECISKVLFIIKDNLCINKIDFNCKDNNISIILNKTVLYPESGGQKGDKGFIIFKEKKKTKFIVKNTILYGDYILHIGYIKYGILNINDIVIVKYDLDYRNQLSCNHSATHLLKYVLSNVLKTNIYQNGSNIKFNFFSFDFFCDKNLTKEDIFNINKLMNFYIWKNLFFKIKFKLNKNDSKIKLIFSKDKLFRVVKINNISEEYCCGTHVKNSKEIGLFYVIDYYNISSKIKRIEATTNFCAIDYLSKHFFLIKDVSNLLSVNNDLFLSRILSLFNKIKKNKNDFNEIKFLYINDIFHNLNYDIKGNIYIYNKFNYLLKEIKNFYFLKNKEILFYVFNKFKFIYKLSLMLFIIIINNIVNCYFYIDKCLLNKIGILNFKKKINFLFNKIVLFLENKKFCIFLLSSKKNKYLKLNYIKNFIECKFLYKKK